MIKFKIKNNLNDNFIFWQGKKREKWDEKKKVYRNLTTILFMNTCGTIEKRMVRRFQSHSKRRSLVEGRLHTRRLKGANVASSLARDLIIFFNSTYITQKIKSPLSTCLL